MDDKLDEKGDNMKKYVNVISTVLTIFVIASLIFTAPAQALTLGVVDLQPVADSGDSVSFKAYVDLHNDDRLLDNTEITVNLSAGPGYPDYSCTFDIYGNEISLCEDITVELLAKNTNSYSYGYGYGYGYGDGGIQGTQFGYGYGYGYAPGYGYDQFNSALGDTSEFVYLITWISPLVGDDVDYTATISALMSDGTTSFNYLTMDDMQGTVTLVADSDNDGVPADMDYCPGTIVPEVLVPEVKLGVNRFALTSDSVQNDEGYWVFDTVAPPGLPPKGKGSPNVPPRTYTILDTHGCSCEQILDAMAEQTGDDLTGHYKFGCSISVMEDWISQENGPYYQAGEDQENGNYNQNGNNGDEITTQKIAVVDETVETGIDFWENKIAEYTGDWLPTVFESYVVREDGVWVADLDGLTMEEIDAYFTARPLQVNANCGGGCNVKFGNYWLNAYSDWLDMVEGV